MPRTRSLDAEADRDAAAVSRLLRQDKSPRRLRAEIDAFRAALALRDLLRQRSREVRRNREAKRDTQRLLAKIRGAR